MTMTTDAKRTARKVEDSDEVDKVARFGLVCRGLTWFVVGALVMDVAVGGAARADRQGAMGVIKGQPLGEVLLALLAVGFIGYAGWRLLQGVVGHRDAKGKLKRWGKRAASLGRGGIYAFLAVSTIHFLIGNGSPDKTKSITAKVMEFPGGAIAVGVVGVGLCVGGLIMSVRGLKQDFDDKLKRIPKAMRTPVHVIATIGLVGRGLVFSLVGGFVTAAAVTYDPGKARGLDESIKTVRDQPYGPYLIGIAAVGLLCFGLWSFAEARWRKI
jgi:hypothetical protein